MKAAAVKGAGARGRGSRLPDLGMGPQIVALLLVLGLLGAMAIEPTRQLVEQRERIEGLSQDLEEIQSSNAELETRIGRLQDPDFLEQRARDMGLVRPGETAYVVMPPSRSKAKAKRKAAAKAPAPAPAEPGFIEGFLAFMGIR
ncbi:MAG: FtsB family cell division protein [Actinomycetota bacterium]